ncbi:conserved hypothetical protein [Methanohalobium evestigatum Z-7303]|uniref:Uncharacterized protein n=1 Tax=Methanohalobium evestigatum (strain ATCC BAA-1072 / DSM 3721 / NBRC 107634 / OCM 161 / Z-7303) TaxID=644295 RepID=D7EBH5_METEZ|nr:hypothetical protein [Methanohalobium evestigatum]ADI74817.1 conserved hypothetical protein [Methanohalobium evestigatum Z-7303]
MVGIFGLMTLVAGIVFVVLMVWLWKKSNLSTLKKSILSLLLIVVLIAGVFGSFAYVLISSDHAYYSADGLNLDEVDYGKVINNARESGYTVNGPYFVNSEIENANGLYSPLSELEQQFGKDYWVVAINGYYTQDTFFELRFPRDESGTKVTFFNGSRTDPYFSSFKKENLPDDEWIIDRFMLLFDIDNNQSQDYLNQLKDKIRNVNKTSVGITIQKTPDIDSIYKSYQNKSSNITLSPTHGGGWTTQTFYTDGNKSSSIDYVIPNMKIINLYGGAEYTIQIDKLGGVNLEIELDAGEQIPEEEYIQVFKNMFDNIGLPPEKVDEFEFDYRSSVW